MCPQQPGILAMNWPHFCGYRLALTQCLPLACEFLFPSLRSPCPRCSGGGCRNSGSFTERMAGSVEVPRAWRSGGRRQTGQNGRTGGTHPGAGSAVKEACSEWPLNQPLATPAPHAPHCPPWHKSPPAWLAVTSGGCRVETGRRGEMALVAGRTPEPVRAPAITLLSGFPLSPPQSQGCTHTLHSPRLPSRGFWQNDFCLPKARV